MIERDLDAKPYSDDEKRVAKWFFDHGTGGGDDPIGSMIASHEYLAAQRNAAWKALEAAKEFVSGMVKPGKFPTAITISSYNPCHELLDKINSALGRD